MATVNIGNLTFTHKGDYASGTQYVKNDVVYYSTNGNAYIAKQTTTGNAPTNGTYWSQFAAGSGGIWNAGLSLGSANQILQVNSGGNALEFTAAPVGSILQTVYKQIDDKSDEVNEDQNQLLKIVKDISSKGFLRSNYKKKLVDLSDIRINLKGKK